MKERLDSNHLAQFIQTHNIQAEILHFDVHTPTVAVAAEVAGVGPEQIVKSVLFMADGEPVLVLACGTSRIAWKRLKMANATQVLAITGYEVGSVSPIGQRHKLRTIVEATIPTLEIVLAGGGELNALLQLETAELLRLVQGEVVALVEEG